MNKKKKIYGYGFPKEFTLDANYVKKQLSKRTDKGKFIKEYAISVSSGGGSWNAFAKVLGRDIGLQGVMYEFEHLFFVVWSCGEYID